MIENGGWTATQQRGTSAQRLLLLAGFLAWAAVVVGEATAVYRAPAAHSGFVTAVCLLSLLLFAVAFWLVAGPWAMSLRARRWALALQSAAALGVAATSGAAAELALILLVVVSGQLRAVWSPRVALAWLIAQNALEFPLVLAGKSPLAVLQLLGSYAAFQAFAWAMAHLARSAGEARTLYATALAELAGTQAELGEAHRTAERLRIARELHDQVGHQLTGLSLQLEVATNTSGAQAAAALDAARTLAKETLGDLRQVVGALRESPEIDLVTALRSLVVRIQEPPISLSLPENLDLKDSAAAWALFRCAQEGVTNAVRHAAADHVRLVVEQTSTAHQLAVEDDGRGSAQPHFGNGLTGLRERLSALGGTLHVASKLGAGFTLRASLPRSAA